MVSVWVLTHCKAYRKMFFKDNEKRMSSEMKYIKMKRIKVITKYIQNNSLLM